MNAPVKILTSLKLDWFWSLTIKVTYLEAKAWKIIFLSFLSQVKLKKLQDFH